MYWERMSSFEAKEKAEPEGEAWPGAGAVDLNRSTASGISRNHRLQGFQ